MKPKCIPYGRQNLDHSDIQSVAKTLSSDWITQGPKVLEFEKAIARFSGAPHAVAVSSGTAGLHAAMYAAGIGPGDEVIVPPITFVSTVNSIVFQGGTPVFADVDPQTLLLDPKMAGKKVTSRTKAIVAVDYAGQPCDYDALQKIAKHHGLILIADACHSLGAKYKGRKVGTLADLSVFSFHPVKHITTGEGGMIVTSKPDYADRMVRFRNHGLSLDQRERVRKKTWQYHMEDIGYNYRITDFQCALGLNQLKKLASWLKRRNEIATIYNAHFQKIPQVKPLQVSPDVSHAYHLYVIQLNLNSLRVDRKEIFSFFRKRNILVNVHYLPVHLQPFYQKRFGTKEGLCPIAEQAYETLLSLPLYPSMTRSQISRVIQTLEQAAARYGQIKSFPRKKVFSGRF